MPEVPRQSPDNILKPDTGKEKKEAARAGRRNFLKGLGLAAATAMLGGKESASEEEPGVSSFLDVELFDSTNQKIEYPLERKERTVELLTLIQEIGSSQVKILQAFGLPGQKNDAGGAGVAHGKETESEQLASQKRELWKKIQAYFKNLPAYSNEAYAHFLIHELPRDLAPYGVFVKPMLISYCDEPNNLLKGQEAVLGFFEIEKIESAQVDQWGTAFKRDALYIQGPLLVKGESVNPRDFINREGEAFFQNVIIYEPSFAQRMKEEQKGWPDFKRVALDIMEKEWWEYLKKSQDYWAAAVNYAIAYLVLRHGDFIGNQTIHQQDVIAHETGHIVDMMNKASRAAFRPQPTEKLSEFRARALNFPIHKEINGMLSELRYSPSKSLALFTLLQKRPHEQAGSKSVDQYDIMREWLLAYILHEVKRAPSRYGIEVQKGIGITEENQILAQLGKLVERPQEFDKLLERIYAFHAKNYDKDFTGYVRVSEDYPEETSVLETLGKVGAGAVVAAGVVYGVGKVVHRRIRMALEKGVREALTKVGGEWDKTVANLQLTTSAGDVDHEKRQSALLRLIKTGEKQLEVAKVLSQLERFMNEENRARYKNTKGEEGKKKVIRFIA